MGEIKRGIVFGCFDPLHAGHIRMLRKCRSMCDYLMVFIHSDEYINREKGRRSFFDELSRVHDIGELKSVDKVFINSGVDRNSWIRAVGASIIFVSASTDGKGFICETIRIPRTEGVSSTSLRGSHG